MADYREKIKIEIETDIDTDKIGEASESFNSLEGTLKSLDGSLSNLNVDEINEGLDELGELGVEGLDAVEDRADSITETIGTTRETVAELNEVLGRKITFDAELDTDTFIADISDRLGEDIDEKDLTVPVAPKGKLETPDVQELESDISDFMEGLQQYVDDNEELHIKPRVAKKAKLEGTDYANISNGIKRQLSNVHPKITPKLNMEEVADDDLEELQKLADALEVVETKKEDVSDENEKLSTRNEETTETTDAEAQSFTNLIEEADNLTSVKRAAGRANEYLSDTNKETAITALEEKSGIEKASAEMEAAKEVIRDLEGHQKDLGDITRSTTDETEGEGKALREIVSSGDSAAEMKEKVSKANRKLGGISEETAKKMGIEGDALQVLTNAGLITSNSVDEVTDSSRSLSRTLSAANESVDETGDSLRAAAEIGDIFEDGLGSLSVNLGAFTIALRNFLTQIPLLITALGAAAEAAAGAASAFIAVAGAIGSAIAAGAIARARQLKEEYSQIEELGQGVQVIFSNVRDTLLEAAEPALNQESIELFKRAVEGTATVVNLLAQAVNALLQSGDDYSLQDAFDDLGSEVLPQVERVVNALIYSFRELGEETIGVLGIITGALADLIVKSTNFVKRIEDLGEFVAQFRDTVSALSELGLAVGSGLIPVFSAFSSIMEGLANALNQVDDEFVANLVTYTAAVVAFSKLSGVASTLVTILPNLALGFSSVATEVGKADSAFKAFRATAVGTNARIANFLSQISAFTGVTSLVAALGGMNERFRQIAFRSSSATARFEALALGTNVTAQQLYELAVAGDLSRDMMEGLQKEAEEVDEDFRKLQLRLALTEEQFKSLDGVDFDLDEFDADIEDPDRLLDTGGIFSGFVNKASSASKEAKTKVAEEFTEFRFLPEDERGYFPKMESAAEAAENISVLEIAQYDLSRASDFAKQRLNLTNLSSKSLRGTIKALGGAVLKTASTMAVYTANLYKTIGASLWTLATTGSLSQAFGVLKSAKIADTIATYAQTSALYAYITGANLATISTYALMAALTKLTFGAYALVAVVGALAVGIITNFEKIKSAGSGALSSLMPLFGAIKDVLLTTFVETWNVIVSAVTSLITIFSPLINVVKDFLGIFGLLTGTAEEGSDSFSLLGFAADIIVGALKALSESLQIVFAIVGVLGKAFMLLLVTPAKIAIGIIRGLAESLNTLAGIAAGSQLLQEMFTGVENLISLLSDLRDGFKALPDNIEDAVNAMIKHLNDAIHFINNEIPVLSHILNIGEVSEVELTGGGLETDREELAADSANAVDGMQEVASNVINMKTENNQTVNQTVNADPEDKSTVSRVVEDAIERANRFDKTRSGI